MIVATGSTYRRLDVPGEDSFIGAGIHFCATCDGPFYRGAKELLVIGGGNSGVEEGLFLTEFADRVTLLEVAPELRASALLQERARSDPKFRILTNTEVIAFRGGSRIETVEARNTVTGKQLQFRPAGVFVFIGLTPNSGFLDESVATDRFGFIETDLTFKTSLPGVYAAGDVRAGSTKQLASATGEGVTALLMVRQYLRELGEVSQHSTAVP